MSFQTQNQNHQVNHEQQHNGRFENHHPAVGLVVLEQLIEVVERLQLAVNGPVPVAKMEAQGDSFVNPRQMPVAKKLGDVRQFVVEARKVNAQFAQLAQDVAARAEPALAEVAVG